MKINDFDNLFEYVIRKIKGMTYFQIDCYLYRNRIYQKYQSIIPYDEKRFISMIWYNDIKFADDHMITLMLENEVMQEKYDRATIKGVSVEGIHYTNYFKRDYDGFWHFSYYEEE